MQVLFLRNMNLILFSVDGFAYHLVAYKQICYHTAKITDAALGLKNHALWLAKEVQQALRILRKDGRIY